MKTSMTMSKLSATVAGAALATLGMVNAGSVEAATISYQGTLLNGVTETATVLPGDNTRNPNGWSFWQFFGQAGDNATLTVRRLAGGLDPAFGVWLGQATDTTSFTDIFNNGSGFPLVAAADDDLPPAIPGPFGDPQASFTLTTTGFYTVGVTSFASVSSNDPFPYEITLTGTGTPIPTPAILPGLIGMGVAAVRKRKAEAVEEASEA